MRAALLELLGELGGEEWAASTVCPRWAVRDVAAHLLHDDLRRLSRTRDRYAGGRFPAEGESLVEFLDGADQRWVSEAGFLSPALVIDLLTHTSRMLDPMWAEADLDAPSERVWWAGLDQENERASMAHAGPAPSAYCTRQNTWSSGSATTRTTPSS